MQETDPDTVVVAAKSDVFEDVFLGENCWYAIRISARMLKGIKYIAAYQTSPKSAITHYAAVARIERHGTQGKFKVVFKDVAKPIGPIPRGDAPSGIMQGPRYTSLGKLMSAQKLMDLF